MGRDECKAFQIMSRDRLEQHIHLFIHQTVVKCLYSVTVAILGPGIQ